MNKLFFLSHPRRPTYQVEYDYQYDSCIKENIEEAHLIAQTDLNGFNLIEPFKEIPQDDSVSEEEAMQKCIRLLLNCDGIIMTGDWKNSEGCKLEFAIAQATGKTVLELNDD